MFYWDLIWITEFWGKKITQKKKEIEFHENVAPNRIFLVKRASDCVWANIRFWTQFDFYFQWSKKKIFSRK